MTAAVRGILSERWSAASEPPDGWVFPAEKVRMGHVMPNTIYQPQVDAVRRSGVRPFVLYSLRHAFLTRLVQSGCSPWTPAKIGGHADINVSNRYVRASGDEASNAIEQLESSETKMKQVKSRRVVERRSKTRIAQSISMG
jgi:integrase